MAHHAEHTTTIINDKKSGILTAFTRKLVESTLSRLEHGRLQLISTDGVKFFGDMTSDNCAVLQINDDSAFSAIAMGGSVGAGEAYIEGAWSSPDIVGLIRLFAQNEHVVDTMERGLAGIFNTLMKSVYSLVQKNTIEGSRKNISAHYDLGNDMFSLFLDETMMYSCAIYPNREASLHEAQLNRLQHIGRKLKLKPEDHLLEIGTGWGGLAAYMAETFGCRVTTTTISREQYNKAKELIREKDLEDRVTVLLEDYRLLQGTYDKLVSIEMIEAVGYQYYDEYFRTCSNLLKDDGLMLIQAILIDDRKYEQSKKEVDFIKRYVFPGSCIPSQNIISRSVMKNTDMSTVHLEDITPHYARTLREWRKRFLDNRRSLLSLGYDESFIRTWDFYFAYCQAGFEERTIRTAQFTFAKPHCRQDSPLDNQIS